MHKRSHTIVPIAVIAAFSCSVEVPEASSQRQPSAGDDRAAANAVVKRLRDRVPMPPTDPAAEATRRPARISLPSTAAEPFEVADQGPGMWVRVALAGVRAAPPEATADAVVYRGATPAMDIVHRPSSTGIEDYILLESSPEPFVDYAVSLGEGIAGMRLVGRTLEFLDEGGAPRVRMAPPFIVDAEGERRTADVIVDGCDLDTSPAAPWGRRPVAPGGKECHVRISWPGDATYPIVVDPSWATTGSLAVGRAGHTATMLDNGRVLVTGGGVDGIADAAEVYDPLSGTWAGTGTPLNRRSHVATRLLDGRVLVAGGTGSFMVGLTAELYDPLIGTWTSTGNLGAFRFLTTANLLQDGRVLVAGGRGSSNNILSSAEIFNPATGTWSMANNMGTARQEHSSAVLPDGRVLVVGGVNGGGALTSAETFDPSSGNWTPTTSMASARYRFTATALVTGDVLVAGGYPVAVPERYHPSTALWSSAGSAPMARTSHQATLLDGGGVLVSGGIDPGLNTQLATTELYDPAANTWTAKPSLVGARQLHTASLLPDGSVLVAGGGDAVVAALTTAERYGARVKLNEIRVDQTGTDNDEYFELAGPPGESLDGLSIVVLGDGTNSISGNVEAVVGLTGHSIGVKGFFVVAESTFTLGTPDLVASFSLENDDNLTVLLVEDWTGTLNQDLDPNDDCKLDVQPWTFVHDSVAILDQTPGGDCVHSTTHVGPSNGNAPGQVYRCHDTIGRWVSGAFDIAAVEATDTPGAPNAPCGDLGDACTGDDRCAGGQCVDGVCCDTACGGGAPGDCMACNVASHKGACWAEVTGAACGDAADDACTDPDTCDGAGNCNPHDAAVGAPCGDHAIDCRYDDGCDGAGACIDKGLWPQATPCGDPADGDCTDPDTCDALGNCLPHDAPAATPCGDQAVECHMNDACNGIGVCVDAGFAAPGAACGDQGVPCRADDACDNAGACVDSGIASPGTPCPTGTCDDTGGCAPPGGGGAGGTGSSVSASNSASSGGPQSSSTSSSGSSAASATGSTSTGSTGSGMSSGDDGSTPNGQGCSCETSGESRSQPVPWIVLIGLVMFARSRRTARRPRQRVEEPPGVQAAAVRAGER